MGSKGGLRNIEHQEHDSCENSQTCDGVGQNCIDLILEILVLGQYLAGLDLGNNLVDKLKTLAVSSLDGGLAGQIHIALVVGSLLSLAVQCGSSLHNFLQAFATGGSGVDHRAAQLLRQCLYIDLGLLLLVDVVLVQSDNNGDAQLQQLGGEEQGAAQIGGIHDVDDGIGMLVLDVATGNALFGSEGRHGVGTGKVNGDQFQAAGISLLNGSLFLVNGNTSPVADLFIATGQRIVHGSLAAVGIARKSNSHGWIPP